MLCFLVDCSVSDFMKKAFLLLIGILLIPAAACAWQAAPLSYPVGTRIAGPPQNAEILSYVSNNTDVAVVNSRGQIAIVGAGDALLKIFN